MPKLSVIMPCYNAEKTVARAIESILYQTLKDFEFIIIDDGSTDGTADIISHYFRKDSRIKFAQNVKNINLAASLNRGIELAQSDLIVRMDADDENLPQRLKKQYEFLGSNPNIDVLGTNVFFIRNGKKVGESDLPLENERVVEARYKRTFLIHPSVVIRKRTFAKFGQYDEKLPWAEDTDLWLRWLGRVNFANLKEPLLNYTVKTRINFPIIYYNHYVLIKNMLRRSELLKNFPLVVKSLFSHFLRLIKN